MTFTESTSNTQIHKHTITVVLQEDRGVYHHNDKVGIAPFLSASFLFYQLFGLVGLGLRIVLKESKARLLCRAKTLS